jgi:hypothetical protein
MGFCSLPDPFTDYNRSYSPRVFLASFPMGTLRYLLSFAYNAVLVQRLRRTTPF